jgi:hypothetical protein
MGKLKLLWILNENNLWNAATLDSDCLSTYGGVAEEEDDDGTEKA